MKHLLAAFIVLVMAGSAQADPRLRLSAPDQAAPGTMTYTVAKIHIQYDEDYVIVELVGENGESLVIRYISDEGRALIADLYVAGGPKTGLQMYFLQRILRDGRLTGTVAD